MTNHLQYGLRFNRAQARVLRNLHDRVVGEGLSEHDAGLYLLAAQSCEQGEPLVVKCSSRDEVEEMAAVFARLGVRRPTVEDLNAGQW